MSYSFRTLFIKTNSSWLSFESIKALEIKISILFNFYFPKNTILSCFFLFSLLIGLYFLISAAITHILNPIVELVIPTGIPSKEAKPEIEIHSVIVEAHSCTYCK